jgi:RimJ/RimL family protein N-acetyltransferase
MIKPGPKLCMLPMEEKHAPFLQSLQMDWENADLYRMRNVIYSIFETTAWYRNVLFNNESLRYFIVAANDDPDKKPIGLVYYSNTGQKARVIEQGIYLDKKLRTRPTAILEIMHISARYVFETLNFRKIKMHLTERRKNVMRALQAIDWIMEGRFIKEVFFWGKYYDEYRLSFFDESYHKFVVEFEASGNDYKKYLKVRLKNMPSVGTKDSIFEIGGDKDNIITGELASSSKYSK